MHTLLLTPTDTLFFRDGRPMSDALAGHGATFPAPHIVNTALHAALHRAGISETAHKHRSARNKETVSQNREQAERTFGSLKTVGPFPVFQKNPENTWYFPTPADLIKIKTETESGIKTPEIAAIGVAPTPIPENTSSLPKPLTHALISTQAKPDKDNKPSPYIETSAFQRYLENEPDADAQYSLSTLSLKDDFIKTDAIFDAENRIGIGIDPATNAQDGKSFYSAKIMRLRDGWKLGTLAEALDKDTLNSTSKNDLIERLSKSNPLLILGGQQGTCTLRSAPDSATHPLPFGLSDKFPKNPISQKYCLKWILLTPAIFPATTHPQNAANNHRGGWLPNWIDPKTGKVRLKIGDTSRQTSADGKPEPRDKYRERIQKLPEIEAHLVAALVGKPEPITGYSLGNAPDTPNTAPAHGAKPTQFAVPAGSIYYFECATPESATQLAAALNWHGSATKNAATAAILNRRSTLLGEKGFGIGVCGKWQPFQSRFSA